jgi:flavin-dependent dehydrogenase
MPWQPRRCTIAHGQTALVGDAAGYVEPFTGEGMSWAIQCADVLAGVLADVAPGTWAGALARRYIRAWKHQVGRRQRVCRLLACALARPRLWRLLFDAGSNVPWLTRRLVDRVVMP